MAIDVLGLAERVSIQPADTTSDHDSLRQQNPLGKIPCLVRADGSGVYDSSVILEFLQEIAGSDRLVPARGMERMEALVLSRLADGIIDAGAVIIYEDRCHPDGTQSDYWKSYQCGKMHRALAQFEQSPPPSRTTNAVSIGLACALGFLDKRKLIDWRGDCPNLVAWLDVFSASEPSFGRTTPPEH